MSKPNPSVTPKTDSPATPALPPCNVPYRWILHVGCCVSVYFDPHQPAAVWDEHQHPEIQVLYFGPGSDCTIHWMQDGAWTSRDIRTPVLWVIGAGISHKLEWRQPALRLVFYVQPSFVAECAGQDITGSSLFSIETVERCNPKIPEFLHEFKKLEQPPTKAGSIEVESLGSLLTLRLFESWGCLTRPQESWATIAANDAIAKINALIDERIDQKILVEDMARAVGMSESKLTHVLKQRLGISPGRYLIERRIQKSKTFLVETNWTVGGIAVAVGFSNQGHFDLFFKKHTGKTPREYRLLQQNNGIS